MIKKMATVVHVHDGDIAEYLRQLSPFVALLDRHQHSCDTNLAEQVAYRGEEHLQLLLTICNRAEQLSLDSGPFSESRELHRDLWELFSLVNRKLGRFINLAEGFHDGDVVRTTTLCTTVSVVHCGTRGRPSFFISRSQLEAFMELGFSYSKIARMLCISERTLQRRRAELGLPVGRSMLYSTISDEELDEVVSSVMQVHFTCDSQPPICLLRIWLSSKGT